MKSKKVSESALENQVHEVFPEDLNAKNIAFGGRVLEKADRIAAIVARRHQGKECVTLGVDPVRFLAPAHQGDLLIFNSVVTRTWHTSMEIEVEVYVQKLGSQKTPKRVMSAYFTFVAINKHLKPIKIRPVTPETEDQIKRFHEAGERRKIRLSQEVRRGKS